MTLTDAIRSGAEVYVNTAIATAATASDPELNVIGQPKQCDVRKGESLYVRALTLDAAVNGTIRLFL